MAQEMKSYEVGVRNVFTASGPEDAVRQMVAYLAESAEESLYVVSEWAEDGGRVYVDAVDALARVGDVE